jgi:hypothetical protein
MTDRGPGNRRSIHQDSVTGSDSAQGLNRPADTHAFRSNLDSGAVCFQEDGFADSRVGQPDAGASREDKDPGFVLGIELPVRFRRSIHSKTNCGLATSRVLTSVRRLGTDWRSGGPAFAAATELST